MNGKSQKKENLLNLSLDATEAEREKSPALQMGYDQNTKRWELIIQYNGTVEKLQEQLPQAEIYPLSGGYAIVRLPESQVDDLAGLSQVEYIEKPKRLYFEVNRAIRDTCIAPVQSGNQVSQNVYGRDADLSGRGTLTAIIDSGIDYFHPDFRNADGTTRIAALWDQEQNRIYTREELNRALEAGSRERAYEIVQSRDVSGHGTAVAAIAAGNGWEGGGHYRGVAWESELLVVKLGTPLADSFPRTTELMRALDYVVGIAQEWRMPVAVNLSFGNTYGSHDGTSLLETYLNSMAERGRTSIIVGTGNEGNKATHTSGVLGNSNEVVPLQIGDYERSINLQIWKQYVDEIEFSLEHPNGEVAGPFREELGIQRFRLGDTEILIYYGEPKPFSTAQEIYLDFIPVNTYVDTGVWKINLIPKRIVDGTYDMWLPSGSVLNQGTRFLYPMPETTLTIPSTAQKVVSVGAYDSRYQAVADFSGRGYTRENRLIKPDIAAPGVNIMTTAVGGGYRTQSGTSFATPFVTGSAALLMEFGIVRGNDPYLYGEKVKAYLIRGARHLLIEPYPNQLLGWGALCLKNSIP